MAQSYDFRQVRPRVQRDRSAAKHQVPLQSRGAEPDGAEQGRGGGKWHVVHDGNDGFYIGCASAQLEPHQTGHAFGPGDALANDHHRGRFFESSDWWHGDHAVVLGRCRVLFFGLRNGHLLVGFGRVLSRPRHGAHGWVLDEVLPSSGVRRKRSLHLRSGDDEKFVEHFAPPAMRTTIFVDEFAPPTIWTTIFVEEFAPKPCQA